jgi:hypothetical protein
MAYVIFFLTRACGCQELISKSSPQHFLWHGVPLCRAFGSCLVFGHKYLVELFKACPVDQHSFAWSSFPDYPKPGGAEAGNRGRGRSRGSRGGRGGRRGRGGSGGGEPEPRPDDDGHHDESDLNLAGLLEAAQRAVAAAEGGAGGGE